MTKPESELSFSNNEPEEKFTKGPWQLWRGQKYIGGGEDICIGAGDTWLANMDHRVHPHSDPFPREGWLQVSECDVCSIDSGDITEEQLANAYLIAAAPEMYYLLQKALDTLYWQGDSIAEEIEELLAKARGENNGEI